MEVINLQLADYILNDVAIEITAVFDVALLRGVLGVYQTEIAAGSRMSNVFKVSTSCG